MSESQSAHQGFGSSGGGDGWGFASDEIKRSPLPGRQLHDGILNVRGLSFSVVSLYLFFSARGLKYTSHLIVGWPLCHSPPPFWVSFVLPPPPPPSPFSSGHSWKVTVSQTVKLLLAVKGLFLPRESRERKRETTDRHAEIQTKRDRQQRRLPSCDSMVRVLGGNGKNNNKKQHATENKDRVI